MGSFLYFLPTPKQVLLPEDLRAAGLGHALHPAGFSCPMGAVSGPGGVSGVIGTPDLPGRTKKLHFDPQRQTWFTGPGGKYHVGMWNDDPPGPDDLTREQVYPGITVRLADGNDWIIPRAVAILPERRPDLPYRMGLGPDGETIIGQVDPRYQKLCAGAFEYWLFYSQADNATKLTVQDLAELAVSALAVNYRVSKIEAIGLLSLLGEEHVVRIARALIDADEIEAFVAAQQTDEKKAGPASGTSAGNG